MLRMMTPFVQTRTKTATRVIVVHTTIVAMAELKSLGGSTKFECMPGGAVAAGNAKISDMSAGLSVSAAAVVAAAMVKV